MSSRFLLTPSVLGGKRRPADQSVCSQFNQVLKSKLICGWQTAVKAPGRKELPAIYKTNTSTSTMNSEHFESHSSLDHVQAMMTIMM